ncbi:MAG: DnaB-like helicase N-terminal domain-containing protein [Bacteroidia bacterium]
MSTAQSDLIIEKICLSICLKNPVLLENAMGELNDSLFTQPELGIVLQAMKLMIEMEIPVDEFTLKRHLQHLDPSTNWSQIIHNILSIHFVLVH